MKKFRTTKPGLMTLFDTWSTYVTKHQAPLSFTIHSMALYEDEFDNWKHVAIQKLDSTGEKYRVMGWKMERYWLERQAGDKTWAGFLTIEFLV